MPSPYVVDEFPRFPSQHPLSLRALQSSLALFMSPCSRGVREEEREAGRVRGESWDWVITILLCISIMFFLFMLFVFFVHSGEVNELWLVTVHISVSLCHSHIITHRQRCTYPFLHPAVCCSAFPWFMKHFQSAVDKLEDDSMLDPMFPISLCACSHVLNMCRFCICSSAAGT